MISVLVHAVNIGVAIVASAPAGVPQLDVSATMQNILANTDNSPAYTYPTDLTRGIIPV